MSPKLRSRIWPRSQPPRRRDRFAVPPVGGGAPAAEQGVPDPLVVPARRDRAVQLHRPADHRRVPDAVLRPVDGRSHLQRRLPAAARRRDVQAYASALDISFEVRGGLFVRQIHHWAALLFSASIMVHLARIFFTGAFRRPRETNWVIGSLLLILSMFEGYFGYSLPDDLLSGIGLRAALSSITLGMPVIGTWMHWALFGGDFPGGLIQLPMLPRHVRAAHPADPGNHPGAHRRSPGAGVVPEAHPVPRPGPHRERTSSACASCRCSR